MGKLDGNILLIDDDVDVLHTARLILKSNFDTVVCVEDPSEIEHLMLTENFDVIVLDMNFTSGQTTGREGIFWLRKILEIDPDAHVLMNTAYGDIQIAVEAMKEGAIDFLVKPWEQEKLLASVRSVYELKKTKTENISLRSVKKTLSDDIDQQFGTLISKSNSMKNVLEAIEKVAETDANILILGENGTGKELVARMIHRKSKRADCDFINVDLGAISESLFESELFGHVKGAFTDAREDRIGRFEMASKGTLFLDELGNLSLPLQAKLLSAIQNGEIFKVGSSKPIKTDIRLICATNKPIYKMVAGDAFRQDLLYRINTVEIDLPQLQQRIEDIPLLANHFLQKNKQKYGKPNQQLSPEIIRKFQQYPWPGNIRELQHVIERLVIMNPDKPIDASTVQLNIIAEVNAVDHTSFRIDELEKEAIINALKHCGGNLTQAAIELGYGRSTLYRKMKRYEL